MAAPPTLAVWFAAAARALPWRDRPAGSRDPWRTLVSEVMSQQTRLEVVTPRFREWMERFPSPAALAAAGESEVLSMWAGLGYYARARSLHALSRTVERQGWPRNFAGLCGLPGVGPYTAAALASFCFGEAVPALDGNMERVLARFHALSGDLRRGDGRKLLVAAATAWVGEMAPVVNEATMELGALICTPRVARCTECPLDGVCRASSLGNPLDFPAPRPRASTKEVLQTVFVLSGSSGVLLRRAAPGELLAGLWTLPGNAALLRPLFRGEPQELPHRVRHAITTHRITWTVMVGRAEGAAPDGHAWVPPDDLARTVVSSLPMKALRLAGISSSGNGRT